MAGFACGMWGGVTQKFLHCYEYCCSHGLSMVSLFGQKLLAPQPRFGDKPVKL